MNSKSGIFALVTAVILLMTLVSLQSTVNSSFSRTIIVPDDFSTIQAAIDNASSGFTIIRLDIAMNRIETNAKLLLILPMP